MEEFVSEECSASVLATLIFDIERLLNSRDSISTQYNFNRFDLYVDNESKTIRIEDDLNIDKSGVEIVNMNVFLNRIRSELQD